MSNSGYANLGAGCVTDFAKSYASFDHVVSPSGSCVLHLKESLEAKHDPLAHRVHELCEFLRGRCQGGVTAQQIPASRRSAVQSLRGLRQAAAAARASECA